MTPRWGVIADDVTGACDVAAEVSALGFDVALILGPPTPTSVPGDADVVVVGLRTRTAPVDEAVAHSVATARVLRDTGYPRIYQKYCSTFDSTPEGMIGPVADALVQELALEGTVGTPATPHADRTVYRGHLFVGDQLLSDSSLARHPLTPMTDSSMVRVMSAQTPQPVTLISYSVVARGTAAVAHALGGTDGGHVLIDAITTHDLDTIAAAIDDAATPRRLAGGGAGLITALCRRLSFTSHSHLTPKAPPGEELTLVGSASDQTRSQVDFAGGPTVTIDAVRAAADMDAVVSEAIDGVRHQLAQGRRPVVSASHDAERLKAAQATLGVERAAAVVETALGRIAAVAVADCGVRRIIVAGGETSGAVTRALAVTSLRITGRVDPGIAWGVGVARVDAQDLPLAILLKSGNFGGEDMMVRAWGELR